jgi:hypothetical protein
MNKTSVSFCSFGRTITALVGLLNLTTTVSESIIQHLIEECSIEAYTQRLSGSTHMELLPYRWILVNILSAYLKFILA